METARSAHTRLAFALLIFFQLSAAQASQQCPTRPSWNSTICYVEWEGVYREGMSKPCWEPGSGSRSNLACLPDIGDIPSNGAYNIHRCLRKNCTQHEDCRTFCGIDGKCEASPNDIVRSGVCRTNDDCLSSHICAYDDCFRLKICKPIIQAKEPALCEVAYANGEDEKTSCLDSTDFICADDPNIEDISISGVIGIKRCAHKRCTEDSQCEGICTDNNKCNPFPDDRTRGKLGIYYAGQCSSSMNCIGGYECCLDYDFQWQDDPIPWMCQPAATCRRLNDEDDHEEGGNSLWGLYDHNGSCRQGEAVGLVILISSVVTFMMVHA